MHTLIRNFLCLFVLQISVYVEAMDSILKQAETLVEQYKHDSAGSRPIISIAGCSRVGKTCFTEKLLDELVNRKIRARILPLDYFFEPSSQLEYSLKPSEFNNRVGEQMWQFDHRLAHKVLKDIVAKQAFITEPHLDFKTKVKTFVSQDYSEIDLVIVEGIYALSGPNAYDLAKYGTLKIFMDADRARLLAWYCARKRSKGHPNPEEDPITKWDFEEDFDKVIAPSKVNADTILQQDENREYFIDDVNQS